QHLRRDGFGTVAPERREQCDSYATCRPYANAHALRSCGQTGGRGWIMEPELGRAIGTALLSGSKTDADIATLLATTFLLLAPVVQISMLQCQIENGGIISTVVAITGRNLIGKLLRLDEISAA